ncbi:hypothetical protein M430DRAFT_271282 [Amorphotheca resinae ATCC 22711]|uniref:Uncharacterized protein n=1 Tax=Amorphotheca resinae ATCC 22711 TaxID=857342 RepID=A0A2T3ASE8_AMORE|nr:hypothetical protein M430DRAFT_271282 [Amorphotheca resinae ATCC 22711]PSS09284.1 hypothetical protein M430DRAFT_271282 [Amorphotheca resinae ATCC 22711]
MVRYNNSSVLRRLDLDNIKSIKNIMSALAFALDKSSTEAAHKYGLDVALGKMESVWVEYILNAIKRSANYTLLRDAITRFVESRSEPKQRILQAITELESLADEQVLTVPEFHLEEYEEALKRFEALPPLIQPTVEEIQPSTPLPKKRGRPRKNARLLLENQSENGPTLEPVKPTLEPAKPTPEPAEHTSEPAAKIPKKMGRPRKSDVLPLEEQVENKPTLESVKPAILEAAKSTLEAIQPLQKIPKKMGRPRKTEILPLEEQAENKLIPEPAMAIPQAAEPKVKIPKKRGRPPKNRQTALGEQVQKPTLDTVQATDKIPKKLGRPPTKQRVASETQIRKEPKLRALLPKPPATAQSGSFQQNVENLAKYGVEQLETEVPQEIESPPKKARFTEEQEANKSCAKEKGKTAKEPEPEQWSWTL